MVLSAYYVPSYYQDILVMLRNISRDQARERTGSLSSQSELVITCDHTLPPVFRRGEGGLFFPSPFQKNA